LPIRRSSMAALILSVASSAFRCASSASLAVAGSPTSARALRLASSSAFRCSSSSSLAVTGRPTTARAYS
jgi:hypothetical protein